MSDPAQRTGMRHAVITGAAQGIGGAIAVGLARAGYAVTALDVKSTVDTVQRVELAGGSATGVQVDVRDRDAVHAAIAAAAERAGGLDVLVTCAGVYGAVTTIDDLLPEDLDNVLGVNVAGTIWTVQAALPHLRRRGGRVVCVGSVAGRNGGLLSGPHYGPIDTPMLQGRGSPPTRSRSNGSAAPRRSPRSRCSWPPRVPAT